MIVALERHARIAACFESKMGCYHPGMSRLRVLALALPVFLVASSAFADVAPPQDQKEVSYAFVVTGSVPADRVVFAYPCGTSNGAPQDEMRVVESGKPLTVGKRGGNCAIYSIARTAYDDFVKTYTPSTTTGTEPKLAAFAATAQKCSGAPSPRFLLAKTDSRNAIVEELDLTVDATKCSVAPRSVPASGGTSSPAADSGGCGVGGPAGAAAPWMFALAVPLLLLGSRRRRQG